MSTHKMSSYQDKEITCACGNVFIYTSNDQDYYESRGFEPPKRCKKCREEKKKRFEERDRQAAA
jgi:hypothetical protein